MQLLWFILLVGVLVAVHELGHFAAARLCGVGVLRLSLGLGPAIARARLGGTEYVLSAVPLGGYVRLLGESPSDPVAPADRPRAFSSKPSWQRVAIILAGPLANLTFPLLVYFHFHAAERTALSATVGTVLDGQPADGVLSPGDRILAIDDHPVRYWEDVSRVVNAAAGRDLRITFVRQTDERPVTRVVTPRAHVRRDLLGGTEIVGQLGVLPRAQLAQVGVRPRIDTPSMQPGAAGGSGVAAAPGVDGVQDAMSPAARAGLRTFDVITSVQGRPVETWGELQSALASNRGEALLVTYLRPVEGGPASLPVTRLEPGAAQLFPVKSAERGRGTRYETGLRSAELFVRDVEPRSPADLAGLRPGDELTSVDGAPLRHWDVLVQAFEEHPDRPFRIGWRTPDGEEREAEIRLRPRPEREDELADSTLYVFGAEPARASRPVRDLPLDAPLLRAFARSVATTAQVTASMVGILARLVTFRLPSTEIGGPIMIYHLTGVAAARGGEYFLAMLAVLSANLGLLNLLPVPLLDGGQLLFLGVEAARRRPLDPRMRERAAWFGVFLLAALTLLAAHNDIVRYFLVRSS